MFCQIYTSVVLPFGIRPLFNFFRDNRFWHVRTCPMLQQCCFWRFVQCAPSNASGHYAYFKFTGSNDRDFQWFANVYMPMFWRMISFSKFINSNKFYFSFPLTMPLSPHTVLLHGLLIMYWFVPTPWTHEFRFQCAIASASDVWQYVYGRYPGSDI